jgi:hypothetical protein
MGVAREKENGELLLTGYKIQFGGEKIVLEMDRGDGCTTLQLY